MIKFDSVGLRYDGKMIFNGLSFEIGKGDKVAVSGRSGLGKSSIFSLVLGFVQPTAGEVLFEGGCVDEKAAWQIRRKVSFIDQDVSVGTGRVIDWFGFVRSLGDNDSSDFGQNRLGNLMDIFEMDYTLLDKESSELSGGERQRLAIIVSILLGRKVFLLDEVTSALDIKLKKKVVEFFVREKDWTVVVISHEDIWLDNPYVKVFDLEAGKWKL